MGQPVINPSNQTHRFPGVPASGIPSTGRTAPNQANQAALSRMIQQMVGGGGARLPAREAPALSDLFTPEFLNEIAQDKQSQEALMKDLPEEDRNPEGLKSTL